MADLADNIGFGDDAGQQPVGIADDDEITIEVAQKCRGLNERASSRIVTSRLRAISSIRSTTSRQPPRRVSAQLRSHSRRERGSTTSLSGAKSDPQDRQDAGDGQRKAAKAHGQQRWNFHSGVDVILDHDLETHAV